MTLKDQVGLWPVTILLRIIISNFELCIGVWAWLHTKS